MTTLVWPEKTLRPRSFVASIDPQTLSGGRLLTGREAVLATDTGFWTVTLAGIQVRTVPQQRLWRALQARLKGRANAINVPLGVWPTAPWPLGAGGRRVPRDTLFSDGTGFSDGATWTQNIISATIGTASLGATSVVLTLINGAAIEPGQIFGIGLTRAHLISAVTVSGSTYTCTITPPLRAAVTAGTAVNFDNPRVQCVLTSDAAMAAEFDMARFAAPTLTFIERW